MEDGPAKEVRLFGSALPGLAVLAVFLARPVIEAAHGGWEEAILSA